MTKIGGGVDGYKAVDNQFPTHKWGSLEYGGVYSFLDGSVNDGDWFYAIGAFQEYNGGIPGPYGPVHRVELYAESTKGTFS